MNKGRPKSIKDTIKFNEEKKQDLINTLQNGVLTTDKRDTNEPCFIDVDKNIRYIKLKVLKNRNGLAYQELLYHFNAKYNHYEENQEL